MMIGCSALGRMCRNMMRVREKPSAVAASTYSSRLSDRKLARTMREMPSHPRPEDDPAEHVAPDLVRAEDVVERRRLAERTRLALGDAEGSDQRGEDRDEHHEHDEAEPDHR